MKDKQKNDWPALAGIVAIILIFIYVGIWWGIGSFIIFSVILGWKKRHDGSFPTNGPKRK